MDDLAKLSQYKRGVYIVNELQHLLTMCEAELSSIDMKINVSKSCCLRIGPRSNVPCASISCSSGDSLPWVEELRYLDVVYEAISGV